MTQKDKKPTADTSSGAYTISRSEKARRRMVEPFRERREEEPAAAPMETDGEAGGAKMGTSGEITPLRDRRDSGKPSETPSNPRDRETD